MDLYPDKINTYSDKREIILSNDISTPLNSKEIHSDEDNNIKNNIKNPSNKIPENLPIYFGISYCGNQKPIITMNNKNKYTFEEAGCCYTYFMFFVCCGFSLITLILTLMFVEFGMNFLISILIWLLITILPILFGCLATYDTILTLENDSLSITKRRIFRKIIKVYQKGELERIEMKYFYNDNPESDETHTYTIDLILKSGETNTFFKFFPSSKNIEQKGINYMLNLINFHINNNMK